MATKPPRRNPLSSGPIDPATSRLLGSQERREEELHLSPKERSRKAKENEKAKKRLAQRVNWDIPVTIKEQVIKLAEREKIPASQIASLLLLAGLGQLQAKKIRIEDYRKPSKSPAYEYILELPETLS